MAGRGKQTGKQPRKRAGRKAAADLDATLLRLAEIRREPDTPGAQGELRAVLGGRLSHAVARAAEIAGDAGWSELLPDLVTAFERMLENPVKSDPGCRAKEAIADALQALDSHEGELYLTGARHVQLEPVYGGRQDTAAGLRGAAARGLVRMNHPEAMEVLAELLADPEAPARIAAARAIGYHGGEVGLPLLRLKLLSGDREVDVQGECMLAMLKISSASGVPFVARFLEGDRAALAEAAALALGESRAPGAFRVLTDWWERTVDPDRARIGLLAIAMLRSDESIAYLLELVARGPGPHARDAIAAFEIHRHDEAMVERVRETARAREDLDLLPIVEDRLG